MDSLQEQFEDEVVSEAKPQGFVLTDGDVAILRLIHEHRFLRREQISALCGRHQKRLHRRISKLATRRYISTIRLPQQKHIYGIGRAAIPVLTVHALCHPELLKQRRRTHELKELFLKHEMMIVDLHVAFSLASRNGGVALVGWSEGSELYDSVVAVDSKGSNRLPIRPDAFFSLEDFQRGEGANRMHFALEADRSTTTQPRFADKIRAYWHYIEQGLHTRKFGVKGFRILTVTLTDNRAKNLCALTASVVPEQARKYFLFVPVQRITTSNSSLFRDPTCYSARATATSELRPLIPTPDGLQKEPAMV